MRLRKRWLLAVAAALAVTGCAANAEQPEPLPTTTPSFVESPGATGEPSDGGTEAIEQVRPAPVLAADELAAYSGVATVTFSTNCTATLIETGVDDAPAYLLTNGHCVGMDNMPANATIVDEEGYGEARFLNIQGAAEDDIVVVPAVGFEYGTMRGIDVGIVRLDSTLGELRSQGTKPLLIAESAPAPGLGVVNIAAPVENVEEGEQVLRKGQCTLGEPANLIEHIWFWFDAPANDCPGVLGGSSGSPLIAEDQVVSIINTTNTGVPAERGDTCYLGKPCEVQGDEAVFVAGTSYGVDIAGIGACFPAGQFTLGGDCPLPVTTLWDISGGGIFGADGTDGAGFTPQLEFRSDESLEVVVIQDVALGAAASCSDPAAYAGAEAVTVEGGEEEPVIVPVRLPSENGFVLACASVPGQEDLAARFVFSIDAIPPMSGPQLAVEDLGDSLMVDPLFDIPDIADVHVLQGPVQTTDCAERSAYQPYVRQSYFIDKTELPVRFCAVGFDMAGNESPVSETILE